MGSLSCAPELAGGGGHSDSRLDTYDYSEDALDERRKVSRASHDSSKKNDGNRTRTATANEVATCVRRQRMPRAVSDAGAF